MSATLQKNVLAHLFKIHLPHAAGLVLLEGENIDKALHSRQSSLDSGSDMYIFTKLSRSLMALSNRIPSLLAITTYAKAVAEKLGQIHRETTQPSVPPPPLLLVCIWIAFLCCHKQLLASEGFRSTSNVLTIWNFTMLVTTTITYF